MQSAAVYQLKDRVLIHPWHQTTTGLGVASDPYVTLPLDVDSKTLGASVLSVLASSGRTVPHPKSWKGLEAPRLKAAGVRTERAFQLSARSVVVDRAAETLRIEPSRNGGARGYSKGFVPLPDLAASVPVTSTPEEIGMEIRACFERCA